MLWKAVKEVLEIAGCNNTVALEQELLELNIISHVEMPSRGVAGSMNSYKFCIRSEPSSQKKLTYKEVIFKR